MRKYVNKDNELVDENGLRIGDKIKGSKYLRSFCISCGVPIRTTAEGLVYGVCEKCTRSYPKPYNPAEGEYKKGISHLKDYDDSTDGSRY